MHLNSPKNVAFLYLINLFYELYIFLFWFWGEMWPVNRVIIVNIKT